MWPFKKPCNGRSHRWAQWRYSTTDHGVVYHRSCRCGAVQRHNVKTGEVTIWTPDGLDSGLLDKGITRKVYEGLDR